MRYLLVGSSGQLGQALAGCLGPRVAWSGGRDALDVRDGAAVSRLLAQARPDVVINAAAFNAVDQAESEPAEAMAVNGVGASHLARASRAVGCLLVHVSTDYVFDGGQRRPYAEEDCPRPLSVYGITKLAGELLVQAAAGEWLVVRTSAIFGRGGSRAKGGSFVERMVARARAGEPLRVVGDQIVAPSYAPDLARGVVALVEAGARGLFHLTGGGEASWHELASAAVAEAGLSIPVARVSTSELAAPAARPAYSVLDNGRYLSLGLPRLRSWREALKEMMASA